MIKRFKNLFSRKHICKFKVDDVLLWSTDKGPVPLCADCGSAADEQDKHPNQEIIERIDKADRDKAKLPKVGATERTEK